MLNFPTRRVELCKLKIPILNLPNHLNGFKIVQLSDFHFGGNALSKASLIETITLVKTLQPDLICYTGDFINGNLDAIDRLCPYLQSIRGKYGSIAVLGNHDYFESGSAQKVTNSLENCNIKVLQDEVYYPIGQDLAIIGFQCLFAYQNVTRFDPDYVLAQVPTGIPKIVLTHGPRYSDLISGWNIDLQLSGHTHGGQLSLPKIGPLLPKFWALFYNLPIWLQRKLTQVLPRRVIHNHDCKYIRGMYHKNHGYLYVNRGLGTHFPGRLFCRPEVTAITLIPVNPNVHVEAEALSEPALSEINT